MPYKDREKQLEAQRQHYKDNKSIYSARFKKRKQDRKEYLTRIKSEVGCENCGYNKCSKSLDFHHKYQNKELSLVTLASNGHIYSTIDEELKKCIVLCANCHRAHHAKDIDCDWIISKIEQSNTFLTWKKITD